MVTPDNLFVRIVYNALRAFYLSVPTISMNRKTHSFFSEALVAKHLLRDSEFFRIKKSRPVELNSMSFSNIFCIISVVSPCLIANTWYVTFFDFEFFEIDQSFFILPQYYYSNWLLPLLGIWWIINGQVALCSGTVNLSFTDIYSQP